MRFLVKAVVGLMLWGVSVAGAQSIIHIQSPWSSDPAVAAETHYLEVTRNGVATSYEMTDEGDGWFVYTYADAISATTTRTFTVTAGTETWSENVPLADILNYNSGAEVWVYVDASTGAYTLSGTGPAAGSSSSAAESSSSVASSSSAAVAGDTVWFKSPWGTKTAPQLIYGPDTLPMSFAADKAHCGWFYRVFEKSAVASSMPVYFRKAQSSSAYPSASTLDAGPSLSSRGVAYVDGTSATPSVTSSLGSAGQCFDASYTLHVYWSGTGTPSANGVTFSSESGMTGWYEADFGSSVSSSISVTAGSGSRGATFSLSKAQVFPEGVYEAWVVLNSSGTYTVSFARVSSFVIRILSPWTNTSPSLVVNSDTVAMLSVANYCGWFEAKYQGSADDMNVFFKQTVGTEIYTASGLTAGNRIALDSVLAVSDTVWVRPAPVTKLPLLYSAYPKALGPCPVKNLPVMMFDWYDGSRDNVSKYNPSTRSAALGGTTAYGGSGISSDFGGDNVNLCWPNSTPSGAKGDDNPGVNNDGTSIITGMVEKTLGANGVPKKSSTFDWASHCKNAEYLDHWFLPDTLTVVNGKPYTNATCRELTLTLDDDGVWRGQMDRYADSSTGAHLGGMFLLDDFQYLDSAKTIPNPYYDSIPSGFTGIDGSGKSSSNAYHNYSLSMKVQAKFVYVPGQTFEFLGDDDVWVFINNKLVVDIGGVHDRRRASVNLDTLGLTADSTYSFYIFYTERYRVEGNFKMRTSIDLQTDQTYYLVKVPTSADLVKYQTWAILREEGLSCDFSGMVGVDTSLAASDFTLFGGTLPSAGVILSEGANYGGITIDTGYTGFTIDTAAIVRARSLSPGTYTLRYSLKNDNNGSHFGEIYFVVPEYPLPDIVFTDSLWNEISADTTKLGEWAHVAYPVRVAILYAGAACAGCSDVLYLTSSDSLTFLDAAGNTISSVALENGKAQFWVMGTGAVVNGSFTVAGTAVSNTLVWPGINLNTPPVPTLEIAEMFDRTGEGIPDSVYFRFSRALTGKDVVDSLKWVYGDSTVHFLNASDARASMLDSSTIAVTSAAGFTAQPFTGLQGTAYSGSVDTWFTYTPTTGKDAGIKVPFMMSGRISDKVGPIVLSATVSNKGTTLSVLSLTLSESLNGGVNSDSIIQYRFWRAGVMNPTVMRASSAAAYNGNYRYDFYFESHQSELPAVGDSVRLAPGVATDLGGAHPHENNPWVRIVGEQKVTTESSELVELGPDTSKVTGPAAKTVLVDESVTAKEAAAATGSHGELISFNMAEVLANENTIRGDSVPPLTIDSVAIHYEVYYYTNLGEYVNSAKGKILCSDSIFGGDCTVHKGNVFLAWNMRSKNGRLVGTGAYVAHLTLKATAGSKVVARSKENSVWGVRRTAR